MDREKAIKILEIIAREDNGFHEHFSSNKLLWFGPGHRCVLNGSFTAEQLKALAWWMEEYGE